MRIHSLHIHPIKSLLPISLPSASVTALGFPHDRTFVLQRVDTATPEVLQIGSHAPLCLFAVSISQDNVTLTVTHCPTSKSTSFPLSPAPGELSDEITISLYNSSTPARLVGSEQDEFFSSLLGFPTRLVYLGTGKRKVLGNLPPANGNGGIVNGLLEWTGLVSQQDEERYITFADHAPLLITSIRSLDAVAAKLPDGAVTMERFRPNIVLAPEEGEDVEPYEEDYWGELRIADNKGVGETETAAGAVTLAITANCARCQSINVDFDTGGHVDKDRQVLKMLSKDRRVDPGMKYSPVFGRYGFLVGSQEGILKVGDQVTVTKRLDERTVFRWPGVGTSA